EKSGATMYREQERVVQARQQAEQIAKWREIVDGAAADPITDDEIASLEASKASAQAAVEAGAVARRAAQTVAQADEQKAAAEGLAKRAARLREVARSTDTTLEEAIQRAGFAAI